MLIRMMLTCLFLAFCASHCQAQWFDEWFRQKKTQKKYLAQQIVALQAYGKVAWDGYKMVGKGLTVIGDIKDGEFNLYRDFFGSLKGVNPAIKNYAKVADIIALQVKTLKAYSKDFSKMKSNPYLRKDELDYINSVYQRLLGDCSRLLDELAMVATDNKVQLSDDERIQRIDGLYKEMQDNYAFSESFGKEVLILGAGREKEQHETEFMDAMYGVEE